MFNDAESDLEVVSWKPEEQARRRSLSSWLPGSVPKNEPGCFPLKRWGSEVLQWEGCIFNDLEPQMHDVSCGTHII